MYSLCLQLFTLHPALPGIKFDVADIFKPCLLLYISYFLFCKTIARFGTYQHVNGKYSPCRGQRPVMIQSIVTFYFSWLPGRLQSISVLFQYPFYYTFLDQIFSIFPYCSGTIPYHFFLIVHFLIVYPKFPPGSTII